MKQHLVRGFTIVSAPDEEAAREIAQHSEVVWAIDTVTLEEMKNRGRVPAWAAWAIIGATLFPTSYIYGALGIIT